jgi:hypothetical protein
MKKIVFILIGCCFQLSEAQIISFSDINFKNALLQHPIDFDSNGSVFPMIDANNDGQISQAEALLVNKINLSYTEINNLNGLQFFTNLKSIESLFFRGTSFNFPTLTRLENLSLSNAVSVDTNLSTLNLSGNTNLKSVNCNSVASNVNLSNLDQLTNLSLTGSFTSLNLNDAVALLFLNLTAPLQSLNLSNNSRLINLNLYNTNFTTLNLSSCLNLEIIDVRNGMMQTLNLGNLRHVRYLFVPDNQLTSLNANKLFNLDIVYCQNNRLTELFLENDIIEQQVILSGNPNLSSICCDANEVVYMQNQCNTLGYSPSIRSCAPPSSSRSQLTMFPNPVQDQLHLNSETTIEKIEIFSSNGLLVMTSNGATAPLDMRNFPSGLYFVKVYRGTEVSEMKFIKS